MSICGAIDTLFLISGDVASWFQSQSGQPYPNTCFNRGRSATTAGWDLNHRGVLVLLKLQVNSQKLGVQAPQNLEFE